MKIRTVEMPKGTFVDLDDVIIMLYKLKTDPTALDTAIDELIKLKEVEELSTRNRKNLDKYWR